MKFNITRDDANFFVDKEKGVVVCVINETADLFRQFALENFRINCGCDETYNFIHSINQSYSILEQKLIMPAKFVGVARLGESDEWDEDIGRAIAFSRAKDSLLRSFWKRTQTYFSTLYKWLNEAADMMDELGEKFSVNMEKRHNYIEELVGVTPGDE